MSTPTTLGAQQGGTGVSDPAPHGVLIGEGINPIHVITPVQAGYVLTDNGPGNDPSFQPLSGGSASEKQLQALSDL